MDEHKESFGESLGILKIPCYEIPCAPKDKSHRKAKTININLTEEEYKKVKALAEDRDLNPTAYTHAFTFLYSSSVKLILIVLAFL